MNKEIVGTPESVPTFVELNSKLENRVGDFQNIINQMKAAINRINGGFPPVPVSDGSDKKPMGDCQTDRYKILLNDLFEQDKELRDILQHLNSIA